MTGRERILNAINHKESDRIPLDLGATPSSGISAIGYNHLKESLGLTDGHNRVFDVVQQVSEVEDSVIGALGIDVVDLGRTFDKEDEDWYPVMLADGSKAEWPAWFKTKKEGSDVCFYDQDGDKIARMPEGATFFDQTYFPYVDEYPDDYSNLDTAMDKVLWQRLVHSPWSHANEPDFWEKLRNNALKLRETSDKAIIITCGCNLFEWGTFLRRMDNFLMDIYTDPDKVEELLDQLMVRHLGTLEKVCASVGDIVDIIRFGDDLGMDTAMFMAKEKYQQIFKPRHTLLNKYVHEHSQMHTFLHSCGSLYPIIDDLIDAGFECLNPVQTSAYQMDPSTLKKEFGKDITFWGGGCNTRTILNNSTPEEVYAYVRKTVDIFSPGGGFVFNQEHNIMPDVPGENMLAMYRAVKDSQY